MGATLIVAVAFGVFFVAASGAAPSCPTPGNFEIDGDMTQHTCANPQDDWNTPGIGVQSTTQGGTYSTAGKDGGDPSTWTSTGSTPDKTNFAQAYATSRVVGGDFYVFVAWERTSTSGTQGYAIEVDNSGANVSANGTPQPKRGSGGSVFYISSQGSSAPAFDSACTFTSQSDYGQTCTSSSAAAGVTAAINTASMSDPLNHTTQPAGGFFEVALDITTLTGIAPSCPGPSAASVYLRSITGQTSNGNLKGYMAPLSVAPDSTCVPPPIVTTATPGGSSNLPGATQHDEATVGTQAAPGIGSVKFFLCSPAEVTANKGDCSANGTQIGSAVPLDANGQASSNNVSGATTSSIGTYCWRVEFTPGPNDHHYLSGSHTNSDSECFTVIKASPSISTQASVTGKGVVGTDSTSDTATVSGGVNPGGTIQFSITDPNGHKTDVGSPVTVNGDGTYDAPSSVSLALVGTYTWSASYSGDSLNNKAVDNGDNESVTTGKASPSISTKASVTGKGVVGTDSTSDTATVSGGVNPGGTIQFSITDPNGHTTDVGSPVTVNGDGTYDAPSSVDLALVGTYTWSASYSGDSLNNKAVDDGTNESVTSIKASPTISTKASVTGTGVVGTDSTSDTATVSGGDNPGGTIQFSITDPNGHTTDVGSPVTVNGDGTYDAPSSVDLTLVGTYTWSASYSGDSLNSKAIDDGTNESVTSIKASPTISTKASVTGTGVVGTDSTSDTATISGGDNPGGMIQFSITDPNGTKTKVGSPVAFNGDGTYDAPSSVDLTLVGTYTWSAEYLGDSLNNGAVDNGVDESVTSIKASPSINTTPSPSSGSIGNLLQDSAKLSGGFDPTGTITFDLYDNSTCSGTPLHEETASVSGNGTYTTSTGFTATKPITYYWVANYGGDSNNNKAAAGCADEPVGISSVSITKTADHSSPVNAGDKIGFTVEIKNSGTGAATGLKLSDPLPAGSGSGVTWVIDNSVGTPSQFVLSGAAGSQTLSLAPSATTLAAGADYKVHITALTSQTECGTYDNTATLTVGNGSSPPPASAEESCAFHVDLAITKSGSPARQEGLGNITWTMVVTNNGPDNDTGVKVSDPIPGGNTFVSASSTQGTCTLGGTTLTCDIGPMAAKATVTITLVTTPSAPGTITNTVVVMGDRPETTLANNTASASVVVVAPHVVIFCVAVSRITPGHLIVGRKTTVTIHLTRHGKAASGIRVRIKGPKLNVTTKRSNSKGVIKKVVKMKKKGIMTFTPLTSPSCGNKRIGVRGIFTPPVTG
ncbi:MAG TPA: DUF11 domain-containing protein [Gaiellaceae bacterium]